MMRASNAPEGFLFRPDFLSQTEEADLLSGISRLEFSTVQMHGVVAKRRVVHYGWTYGYGSRQVMPGPPLPDFLLPVRAQLAEWVVLPLEQLAEALLTEYSTGAGIGWHRDAPMFGIVAAVSLGSACRMRFRRGQAGARETLEVELPPRSAYAITGPARSAWHHSIPATKALRYSITFRTLRRHIQAPPLRAITRQDSRH